MTKDEPVVVTRNSLYMRL